ncbi:hypothetical protein LTR85_008015 [Meristemomyces frigidus]|nr:hypothetical protein LTR85_008015 [Meristemomyces frigidus]
MQFTTLLTAAVLTSSAISAPVTLNKRIASDTQSCTTNNTGEYLEYTITIGEPFIGGYGCNAVYNTLTRQARKLARGSVRTTATVCEINGNTKLTFNLGTGMGGALNDALTTAYPMVNGFNCPSH